MAQLDALNALARNVPGLSKQSAKQQQASQRIQARTAAAQVPATKSTAEVGQALATPLVQAQGQTALDQQAQTQQTLAGIGERMVQEKGFQGQQQLAKKRLSQETELAEAARVQRGEIAQKEMGVERRITDAEIKKNKELQRIGIEQDNRILQLNLKTREDLAYIGNDLEQKIFDARRQFEKDERGRKFTNERQLADYALIHAQDQQQFQDRMQQMQQAAKMEVVIMQAAHDKIMNTLKNESAMRQANISAEKQRELAAMARDLKQKELDAQKKADVIGNMVTGAASGAMIGAAAGGPWGAVAGAGIGGAAGIATSMF